MKRCETCNGSGFNGDRACMDCNGQGQIEEDCTDEIFEAFMAIAVGKPSADVIYALGMMIAHAIREGAKDKNPNTTIELIRTIVVLELKDDTT